MFERGFFPLCVSFAFRSHSFILYCHIHWNIYLLTFFVHLIHTFALTHLPIPRLWIWTELIKSLFDDIHVDFRQFVQNSFGMMADFIKLQLFKTFDQDAEMFSFHWRLNTINIVIDTKHRTLFVDSDKVWRKFLKSEYSPTSFPPYLKCTIWHLPKFLSYELRRLS